MNCSWLVWENKLTEQKRSGMICFEKLISKPERMIKKIKKKVGLSSGLYYTKFDGMFHVQQLC